MKKLGLVALSILFLNAACSDVKLQSYLRYASTQGGIDYCTTPADTIKSNLKFIAVVDKSGSNLDNHPPPILGTDPFGDRRYNPLLQFVQSFVPALPAVPDPSIFWSIINFSTDSLTKQVFPATSLGLNGTTPNMITAINTEHTNSPNNDGGWTDYLAALQKVKDLIVADVVKAQTDYANGLPLVSSNYVVFFVTDGAPVVASGLEKSSDILNAIKAITDLTTINKDYVDAIQINTAYYYNDPTQADPVAAQLLMDMATAGFGISLQFGQGAVIDFNQFAIPTRIAKFAMKDFWITNKNGVWENGKYLHDGDMDGLSDALENQLGSDPASYDSDANGVGDGVEYRTTGKACNAIDPTTGKCSKTLALPYIQCSSITKVGGKYPDKDMDNINDCEERILGSDAANFDSNTDYITDWIGWRNNIGFITGSNDSNLDPDSDGYTNYQEIKLNTPLTYSNSTIANLQTMKTSIWITSDSSSQTCYHIDVTGFGYFANDMIRVDVIESKQVISQRRLLRVAEKPLVGGRITISPSDFK